MTENLFSTENLRFSIAMLWCIIGFGSYYFISFSSASRKRVGTLFKILDRQGNFVIFQRLVGFVFLGALTALVVQLLPGFTMKDSGLTFHFRSAPPWWFLLFIPLIMIMGYLSSQNPGILEQYPQIRAKQWTKGMVGISSLSWVIFLIGYEFFFRGFLLHASLGVLEPFPAVVLNIVLYSFAHLYKGSEETYGAIPVGIILCYITLLTGNIWSAVIVHSLMALCNEWFSLRAHPEMKLIRDA
jgi:membrane protease YdiL (CAAX protease family)